jgi:hypothetical protein
MFILSSTESGLHFMPVLDVNKFDEVFIKKKKKNGKLIEF